MDFWGLTQCDSSYLDSYQTIVERKEFPKRASNTSLLIITACLHRKNGRSDFYQFSLMISSQTGASVSMLKSLKGWMQFVCLCEWRDLKCCSLTWTIVSESPLSYSCLFFLCFSNFVFDSWWVYFFFLFCYFFFFFFLIKCLQIKRAAMWNRLKCILSGNVSLLVSSCDLIWRAILCWQGSEHLRSHLLAQQKNSAVHLRRLTFNTGVEWRCWTKKHEPWLSIWWWRVQIHLGLSGGCLPRRCFSCSNLVRSALAYRMRSS